MEKPNEIQDRIVAEIIAAGDPFNQFNYLLEKAAQLDVMSEERKVPDALVKDCQSQVWLYFATADRRVYIDADSDTLMIRGTIEIMKEMFDGQAPEDVLACGVEFIARTELAYAFDSKRVAGQVAIVKRIRAFAQSLVQEGGA